eukprot:1296893-Pleurochrysis_carterae.AAC.2
MDPNLPFSTVDVAVCLSRRGRRDQRGASAFESAERVQIAGRAGKNHYRRQLFRQLLTHKGILRTTRHSIFVNI